MTNYKSEYIVKFGSLPKTFGLEDDEFFWVQEQIELAVKGKRGKITAAEIDKIGGKVPAGTVN